MLLKSRWSKISGVARILQSSTDFILFCISRMKVRTGKKGRKKLDKEDDASDRGGDGDDADRNNVDVLP